MTQSIQVFALTESYDQGAAHVALFTSLEEALASAEEAVREVHADDRGELAAMRQSIWSMSGYRLTEERTMAISSHRLHIPT